MIDRWFYGRGVEIFGPVSGSELAQLANVGGVLPTDTVWKNDIEAGVPAHAVKRLFSPSNPQAAAEVEPVQPVPIPKPISPSPRPARAVAGKGAVIVGQDGKNVKVRMKCSTCGYDDSSWKTIPITRGTTRLGFFCPKCRRKRDGEINGYVN
jgi:hypothetical protein